MKTYFILIALFCFACSAETQLRGDDLDESAAAASRSTYDDDAPDIDYVWEDGYTMPDGTVVEGFYRQSVREGYVWEDAYWDGDTFVPPGWRYLEPRPGYVYVPGYRGPDGYWVNGEWRPEKKAGYVYVETRITGDDIQPGHWEPVQPRRDMVWVPGFLV